MIDLSKSTDPQVVVAGQVLAELTASEGLRGVPVMVVGATARDILAEVYAACETVGLPGGAAVSVPSVPGLAVLKLTTWSERRLQTKRDAVDLQTVIGWYRSGALLDEVYESEVGLLETYGFDSDLASAHQLGRHMAQLLGADAGGVLAILDDDGLGTLAADMPPSVRDCVATLRALREGVAGAGIS